MQDASEAVKIWQALLPSIRAEIKRQTKTCIRAKKMNVTTAPNAQTGLMGVSEAFGSSELMIPYQSTLSNATVGTSVWVYWFFGDASTMVAMQKGGGT